MLLSIFVSGCLFILATIYFFIYFFHKRNFANLYLGTQLIVLSLLNIFIYLDSNLLPKIGIAFYIITLQIFLLYLNKIYINIFKSKIIFFISFFGFLFFILLICIPKNIKLLNISSILFLIFCILFIIFYFKKTFKKRLSNSKLNFLSFIFFTIPIISFISFNNNIIIKTTPFLYFLFCIIESYILIKHFYRIYKNNSDLIAENFNLKEEIKITNNSVEKKIKEKTLTLEMKNLVLERMVLIDGLTTLYNHKYVYERLEAEIEKSNRYKSPLSIIMFDIDHFKSVNDKYGHQAGDQVLVKVAQSFKTTLREFDIVGRYGGEEFLVILPETNLRGAFKLAERIRNNIKDLTFNIEGLNVTISGGVIELKKQNTIELVQQADKLLYSAKKNGRNRIEKEEEYSNNLFEIK